MQFKFDANQDVFQLQAIEAVAGLLEEFLIPMKTSQVTLAKHLGIPLQRINEIVRGKRGVTPKTAWLFSQAFGNIPEFWMNLQMVYDLARSQPKQQKIMPLVTKVAQ
jgi:addiction module HigA family antidote